MKCSKCGHEIPDGFLLCDKCGYEIQMVPDFEPEVEQSIEESLSNVAEDLITSDSPKEKGNERNRDQVMWVLYYLFLWKKMQNTPQLIFILFQKIEL